MRGRFVSVVSTATLRCCAMDCFTAAVFDAGADDLRTEAESRGWRVRPVADLAWCPRHGRDFDERQADAERLER